MSGQIMIGPRPKHIKKVLSSATDWACEHELVVVLICLLSAIGVSGLIIWLFDFVLPG